MNKPVISSKSVNNNEQSMEQELFIGRKEELDFFRSHLAFDGHSIKVLHIAGAGGVGKTYLLHEFGRLSTVDGALFLKMDSRDFQQTPEGFTEHILTLIESATHTQLPLKKHSLREFLHILTELAAERRITIAIDSYEHMEALDRWFRQVFIRHLPENIVVITAGRHPLKGEWTESVDWRRITKQIQLKDFTLEQTREFLHQYGIVNNHLVTALWNFTDGHPLTLTLAALSDKEFSIDSLNKQTPYILTELTRRWLSEVDDNELHLLIETASLFYTFNQSSLSAVLKWDIDTTVFNELISLSFIKPTKNG